MDIKQLIEEQMKVTKDFPTFGDEQWPESSRELFSLLAGSEGFRGRAIMVPTIFMLHMMLEERRNPAASIAEKTIETKKHEEIAVRLGAALFIAGYNTGKAEAEVAKLEQIASA